MAIKGVKTCLIFGINGQDGYYLNSILTKEGFNVIGISRQGGNWVKGNVADFEFTRNLIRDHQPDYIFHLAANSTVQHFALFENHETISTGTLNILESVRLHCPQSKVFLSGSAVQFKNDGSPISEQAAFEASSPYSFARIQSVYAARYYRTLGLKVYVGYFFHHDSPLRHDRHLNMKIIKAALKIKNGSDEVFEIGDPNVIKEFNHAYDLMKAIWLLVNQDMVFEAVIGSGIGYKIQDWIDICFELVGIDQRNHITLSPHYRSRFSSLISDPKTIRSLKWKPLYDIRYLAKDMIRNG